MTRKLGNKLLEVEAEGLPPSVNHTYGRGYRVYKARNVREYQEQTVELLHSAWRNGQILRCPVALYVTFVDGSRRKWDMDNRIKVLQDCLQQAGVLENDSQIELLVVRRERTPGARKTRIVLCEVADDTAPGI